MLLRPLPQNEPLFRNGKSPFQSLKNASITRKEALISKDGSLNFLFIPSWQTPSTYRSRLQWIIKLHSNPHSMRLKKEYFGICTILSKTFGSCLYQYLHNVQQPPK